MSAHVFHEIYLHLNWHCKGNRPLLQGPLEAQTHHWITQRCRDARGVYLHGINGTATHVHLAINIEPSVTIADLVRDLKGGSAHDVNSQHRKTMIQWQRGYGVVSFGRRNLHWVLQYIARQKEHHARGTLQARLEWIGADDGEE